MVPLNRIRGRVRPAILIAVLMAGIAVPAMAANSFFGPQAPASNDGRIEVAQNNQNTAQLMVRIQDLEQQVRDLTGRVEGLEFQVQQLLKVNEDNEFRFQQLEGTAPVGKPQAAVPTDGATPSDALPQEQTPAVANTDQLPATPSDQLPATPDQTAVVPDLPATDQPMDGTVGESSDPLLNGGSDQLGTLDESIDALANKPLDLNFDGNTAISNGDAKAQFEAGRDAMSRGDYAFASDQLTQFLQYYHDDPAAPDAVNYLGEALIQQKDYQQASQVLAQGYIDYAKSNRAPDIMLRLGVALNGMGQGELACENFAKLTERYPDTAPAFKQRVAAEAQKAQCPAG
jgi:tol-pal system protein YbgF